MIFADLAIAVAGLVLLVVAGDLLVGGATGLARIARIPNLVIGLTIVAFGTSAPELVVSVQAVLAGDNGIATGNIVGSNIANILLVLGLPALLAPIVLSDPDLRLHALVMVAASLAFAGIVYFLPALGPAAGTALLVAIAIYVAWVVFDAMRGGRNRLMEAEADANLENEPPKRPSKTFLFLILGLIGLPLGATMLVNSGASLAQTLGVREELIGLTIIAFGTSLPELATVFSAARKRETEIAAGNVIGSNIFNILFVGGAVGLAGTTNPTTFTLDAKLYDLPMMLASAVVLTLLVFGKFAIGKRIGIAFAVLYGAYLLVIATAAGGAIP